MKSNGVTRREFTAGLAIGAAVATGVGVPSVHAAGSDLVRLALIGAGGRGTGAAQNALSTSSQGPVKLVAMVDVFDRKLSASHTSLKDKFKDGVEVPDSAKFLGFDGYRKAMDLLKPGDVAILTTPPAFRWPMYQYAISKGLNVFMEKPVTVDAPTSKRMLALNEEAKAKNLKVGVGLMIRHCRGRQELWQRIRDGEIGDIVYARAYRTGGRGGLAIPGGGGAGRGGRGNREQPASELLFQVQRFHAFLWASGGIFSDYNIHQVDEVCWMKDAWPTKASGVGGRHYRGESLDQNFDSYAVEYTFPDGTKFTFNGRHIDVPANNEFASYVHGAKGVAVVSTNSHTPGRVRTYKGHNLTEPNKIWAFPQPEPNPYQLEWDDLMKAIRNDEKYNEVERGVRASLVTSMGRAAAHTGLTITYEEMLEHKHEFAPEVDKIDSSDDPAPLKKLDDGTYPTPFPGKYGMNEYQPQA